MHQATCCSNKSRQQVAATNQFACTGEFLKKFLSPQQNFVIASSRTESIRLNLCNILLQETKDKTLRDLFNSLCMEGAKFHNIIAIFFVQISASLRWVQINFWCYWVIL